MPAVGVSARFSNRRRIQRRIATANPSPPALSPTSGERGAIYGSGPARGACKPSTDAARPVAPGRLPALPGFAPSRSPWKLRRGRHHPQGFARAPVQLRRVRMNPAIFRTRRARRKKSHHVERRMPARRDRTSRLLCRAFEGKQSMRASLARIGEREGPRFPASTAQTESSRRPTRERNRLSAGAVELLRFLDLSLLRTFGTMRLSIRFFLSGPRSLTRPFSFLLCPGRSKTQPGFFAVIAKGQPRQNRKRIRIESRCCPRDEVIGAHILVAGETCCQCSCPAITNAFQSGQNVPLPKITESFTID